MDGTDAKRTATDSTLPTSLVKSASTGESIALTTLWQSRKVVIVFLRQLACRFCQQQIAGINEYKLVERLRAKDITTVCVSLGSVEQAKQWLEDTKFQGELYVDDMTTGDVTTGLAQEQAMSYKAFRLKRGKCVLRLDNVEAQKAADEVAAMFPDKVEMAEKVTEGGEEIVIWPGDVFQTGGAFVLGPGNVCDFAFRSSYAGDHIDLNVLLEYATGEDPTGKEIVYESTANWFDRMKNFTKLEVTAKGEIRPQGSKSTLGDYLYRYVRPYLMHTLVAGGSLGVYGYYRKDGGVGSKVGVLLGAPCIYSLVRVGVRAAIKRLLARSLPFIDAINDVVLLTPVDVDRKVLESGLPECDCGTTMERMPMMGMMGPDDALAMEKGPMGRSRSQTWVSDIYDSNEFQTTLCYIREFLAKPHPAVGRGGPVCPFVPTSLKKNCIYMSVVRTSSLLDDSIAMDKGEKEEAVRKILSRLLLDFIPIFEQLEPSTGKLRQFKAVILIFPDVKDGQAHDIIDEVQIRVKEKFVEKGLMCGEFHATNNASGLRNPNFFPLRTPLPCLAIRHMVPGDLAFMALDNYPPVLRVKFLRGFLDVFENDDKPQVAEAKAKLAETLAALGKA